MFDFKAVKDFTRHINQSIPDYYGLTNISKLITQENANPEGLVVDLGCSSGAFLNALEQHPDVAYVGVDVVDIREHGDFQFHLGDAVEYLQNISEADVIIALFTLQFLGRHKRKQLLVEVARLIEGGAVFIVAEKCFFDSQLENVFKRGHIEQKRKHFSDEEILNKEMDLFGSMFCLSEAAFSAELSKLGTSVSIWQSYNFKGYVVKSAKAAL